MKDFVKGECNKVQRDAKEGLDRETTILYKKSESLDFDLRKIKEAIGV